MKKSSVLETFVQTAFLLVVFTVIILLSLGISLDFSKLKTVEYWIEVGAQLALTMIVFNVIYRMDRRNKANIRTSRFFIAYATNRLRITRIYTDKRIPDLEKAVKEENRQRLITRCEELLHKVCGYIKYDDLTKTTDELIKEYHIQEKRTKKFCKIYDRIKSGRVKVKELKPQVFLTDKQLIEIKGEEYDFNAAEECIKHNTAKMITFLITTMLSAIIVFTFMFPNIWPKILSNVGILFGAVISGFISSDKDIKHLTRVYEARNAFILQHLEIGDEYREKSA